jgi:hypothetical protein
VTAAPIVWSPSPRPLSLSGSSIGESLVRHGALLFWCLLLAHALVATIAPSVGFLTLPRDTLEGFLWGRSPQWGYFKHPPLQAWILGLSETLAPSSPWLAFLYAQICVIVTLWAVWRLASDVLGEAQGLVAAILTLAGVHYYGPSMATFTPDTLSAPLWALTGLFWWRAVVRGRPLAWFALALVVALSVYAKYVGLLLVGVLAVLTLAVPAWRAELRRIEFWLALAIGIGLVTPHLRWMVETGFSSLSHAISHEGVADSLLVRLGYCLEFLSGQLVQHTGLLLLVGLCIGHGRFRPRTQLVVEGRTVPEAERIAILVMALAPLAIALAVNFAVGGQFRQGRGTALFAFSGIAAVLLAGPVLRLGRLGPAAAFVLLVLFALPVANAGHHVVRLALGATHVPTLYPAESLAAQLQERWRASTGLPLRVVVGDRWHAGNVAFYIDDPALILLDGNFAISPWLDRATVERSGALLVWHPQDRAALANLRRLVPDLEPEGLVTASSPLPFGPPTTLAYRILPPASGLVESPALPTDLPEELQGPEG